MSLDELYDHYDEEEDVHQPRPRDVKIDEAKEVIINDLFNAEPEEVFYQRQVEILYEDVFFHWITTKALKELSAALTQTPKTRQRES